MYKGALTFETPMLFSIAFVIYLPLVASLVWCCHHADMQYHDTYFVVAHFHYVMVGCVFSGTAAVYYWLPKWCGKMYDETMGKVQFWVAFIGFNIAFMPQHFLGLAGMPRRYADYGLQFADWNMVSSVGALSMQHRLCSRSMWSALLPTQAYKRSAGLNRGLNGPLHASALHTFAKPPKVK